ncbi:MAG: T9SS type A sorting domain-containing protein [Bacteroidales bacterium]
MKRYLLTAIILCVATIIAAQVRIDTPQQVAPENGSDNQMPDVYLDWNAVVNAVEYEVQLAEDSLFNTIVEDQIVDVSAIQTQHLKFDFEYFWRVRALDGQGNQSSWSPVWSFTTFEIITLFKPNDNAPDQDPDVELKWRDRISGASITGVEHFDVQIDTTETFDSPLMHMYETPGDVYEKQMMYLRFGTNYKWRVRARHAGGQSEWSEVSNFTVLDAIELKKPNNNSTGTHLNVDLRWDDRSGIDRFDYQIDENPNFSTPTTYITETYIEPAVDLDYGTTYNWRVRGRHETDTSMWSEGWSFTTAATVNLLLPADGEDSASVKPTFTWEQILGTTEYMINYSQTEDFQEGTVDYIEAADTIVPLYNVLEILESGTMYYWRIKAISEVDTSDFSEVRSFTTIGAEGIGEYFGQAKVSLFPNPAKDEISIELNTSENAAVEFSLIDLTGQTILNRNLNFSAGQNKHRIRLNNLSNGIYMVKLAKGNDVYTNKLIINQ